jgi:hypothetical protein
MNGNEDLALQTLLATRPDAAPNLDEDLLRQCYAIQNKYQFSEDRSVSVSAMERLIDDRVAKLSADRPAKDS